MLKDWLRPSYQPNGGDPFLFYVIYGEVDLESPLSRSSYRSEGIPDGLEVMHYGSDRHADVVSGFREDYLWEEFLKNDPGCAAQVAAANECVVLRGTPTNPANLNYLRDTVGLLTHFLGHGGLCVYDPHMFNWWTPERWRERIRVLNGGKLAVLKRERVDFRIEYFIVGVFLPKSLYLSRLEVDVLR